ncbi:MAG: hypothetical protein AAF403_02665, partial [Pseudomonadota bacterium]
EAIKILLYQYGYKISGVQKILKEKKLEGLLQIANGKTFSYDAKPKQDSHIQNRSKSEDHSATITSQSNQQKPQTQDVSLKDEKVFFLRHDFERLKALKDQILDTCKMLEHAMDKKH